MTREDIIKLAREAGLTEVVSLSDSRLIAFERFAALVAAAEREACIQVIKQTKFSNWFQADCVEAIRARGEAK